MEQPTKPSQNPRRRTNTFRETLAHPAPSRTYRSEPMPEPHPTVLEQIVRYTATVLSVLLGLRFILTLVGNDSGALSRFVSSLTNWLVVPLTRLIPPPAKVSGGYIDWAVVAALTLVITVATLLIWLAQPKKV